MEDNIKQHIGYWINRLRMNVHCAFEQRLARYDVTVAQWMILLTLYEHRADSVGQLAQYIEVDKASISRVVEKLVKQGRVVHLMGKDRRSGLLQLTASGKELVPSLLCEAEANEEEFFGALTLVEKGQLQNILRKILTNKPGIAIEGWLNMESSMDAQQKINAILNQAKQERWPYPRTFQTLKDAGVEHYRVSWLEGWQASYEGNFGSATEEAPKEFQQPSISSSFVAKEVKEALIRHMEKKTSYWEWLVETAAAGASHYVVNMEQHTVTYFDPEEKHSLVERVPSLSDATK
jgi:DNA-binding MarR family transcriptional regulator/uncharacterized protein YbcV (DUF1398 family)